MTAVSIGVLQRVDASVPALQALILAHNDIARTFQATMKRLSRYMNLRIDVVDDRSSPEDLERIRSCPAPILIATVEGTLSLIQQQQRGGIMNNTSLLIYCSYDGNKLFPHLQDDNSPRDPRMMAIRHWLPEGVQHLIILSKITKRAATLAKEVLHDPIHVILPIEEDNDDDED